MRVLPGRAAAPAVLRSLATAGIDSKFIERQQAVLRVLLDEVVPPALRRDEPNFFRRFHLEIEEPSLRLRFLDARRRLHPAVSQLSLWASEPAALAPAGWRVFVIENLTSFLTFPPVPDALALWSGGFAVGLLTDRRRRWPKLSAVCPTQRGRTPPVGPASMSEA